MSEPANVVIPSQASPLFDIAKILEMKLWFKQMQRFDVTGLLLVSEIRFAHTKRGRCAIADITFIYGPQSEAQKTTEIRFVMFFSTFLSTKKCLERIVEDAESISVDVRIDFHYECGRRV